MPINYYCAIAMNGSNIEMNRNQLLLPVIDNESSVPATGSEVAGQMYYNDSTNIMYFYNGSSWIEMDGTGSCVSSFKATDGTYIDYSPNTASTGAVTLTGDLSASGTADSTTFLRGDNTWAAPAGSYSGWTADGDTGTASVDSGGTLIFDGGSGQGITTQVNNSGTGGTVNFILDIENLTTDTGVQTSDFLALSPSSGATKKATIATILALAPQGDITNVSAGDGLSGGGTLADSRTIDIDLKETSISTKGRHDPCVGIRAVPVGEAMLATTIADHCLRFF